MNDTEMSPKHSRFTRFKEKSFSALLVMIWPIMVSFGVAAWWVITKEFDQDRRIGIVEQWIVQDEKSEVSHDNDKFTPKQASELELRIVKTMNDMTSSIRTKDDEQDKEISRSNVAEFNRRLDFLEQGWRENRERLVRIEGQGKQLDTLGEGLKRIEEMLQTHLASSRPR